jgi:hypothetical protein
MQSWKCPEIETICNVQSRDLRKYVAMIRWGLELKWRKVKLVSGQGFSACKFERLLKTISQLLYWKVPLVGAVSSRVLDSRYSCSLFLLLELFYWALIYPTYCISSMFYIIP